MTMTGWRTEQGRDLAAELGAFFPLDELEWKVQTAGQGTNGIWALIVPYISARAIMDRLDRVLGVGGWQIEYPDRASGVVGRLSLLIDGTWIVKEDGAAKPEQSGGLSAGDATKGGYSNALKRVGVTVGIGRYLYELPLVYAEIVAEKDKRQPGVQRGRLRNTTTDYWWKPPATAIPPKYQPARVTAPARVNAPGTAGTPASATKPTLVDAQPSGAGQTLGQARTTAIAAIGALMSNGRWTAGEKAAVERWLEEDPSLALLERRLASLRTTLEKRVALDPPAAKSA